jgi:hypothetical protein
MKYLKVLVLLLLCTVSCQKEPIEEYVVDGKETNTINIDVKDIDSPNTLNRTRNAEMVVKYKSGLTPGQKQSIRNQLGVISIKTCECADPTLELWVVAIGGGITIEDRILGAKSSSGIEGAETNPKISIKPSSITKLGLSNLALAQSKIVTDQRSVTIAVMDTGIAYNYFGFNTPFLYNSANNANACNENGMQDYFGWDFVNQDNDPFDDHNSSHGTSVSYLISKTLTDNNVPHQILPVKVFNQSGQGTYFDILCGFKYAVNNSDVKIINMSFGIYEFNGEILGNFIDESTNRVLITASAGNNDDNTDIRLHYPSGYDANNIIATASLSNNFQTIGLADFSNYGRNTIDVAAKGEDIPFFVNLSEFVLISGTSYSNAYMSAHAAKEYSMGITVQEHVTATLNNTLYNSSLRQLKYSSFINN